MLKLPYEDPSNAEDFKPLGPPLKPAVKEGGTGTLKPTPTPGVYENTKTGKLETDIPENKRVGLADIQHLVPSPDAPLFNTAEFKRFQSQHRADMEFAATHLNREIPLQDPQLQNKILYRTEPGAFQCKSSPTKVKITSESSPEKLSSDPQLSGKSSIAEISLPSGLKIRYSPSCQETPRLVLGNGKELRFVRKYFSTIPMQIRNHFLFCCDPKPPIWWYCDPGVIAVFKDSLDNWWVFE